LPLIVRDVDHVLDPIDRSAEAVRYEEILLDRRVVVSIDAAVGVVRRDREAVQGEVVLHPREPTVHPARGDRQEVHRVVVRVDRTPPRHQVVPAVGRVVVVPSLFDIVVGERGQRGSVGAGVRDTAVAGPRAIGTGSVDERGRLLVGEGVERRVHETESGVGIRREHVIDLRHDAGFERGRDAGTPGLDELTAGERRRGLVLDAVFGLRNERVVRERRDVRSPSPRGNPGGGSSRLNHRVRGRRQLPRRLGVDLAQPSLRTGGAAVRATRNVPCALIDDVEIAGARWVRVEEHGRSAHGSHAEVVVRHRIRERGNRRGRLRARWVVAAVSTGAENGDPSRLRLLKVVVPDAVVLVGAPPGVRNDRDAVESGCARRVQDVAERPVQVGATAEIGAVDVVHRGARRRGAHHLEVERVLAGGAAHVVLGTRAGR